MATRHLSFSFGSRLRQIRWTKRWMAEKNWSFTSQIPSPETSTNNARLKNSNLILVKGDFVFILHDIHLVKQRKSTLKRTFWQERYSWSNANRRAWSNSTVQSAINCYPKNWRMKVLFKAPRNQVLGEARNFGCTKSTPRPRACTLCLKQILHTTPARRPFLIVFWPKQFSGRYW